MAKPLQSMKEFGSNLLPKRGGDERREESRKKILKAASELFIEKGYGKTTMRQIAMKSGMLIGSVYNVFPGKEDILRALTVTSLGLALDQYEKYVSGEDNIIVAVAFPMALELYSVNKDPRAAEILHEAHKSWLVMGALSERTSEWISGKIKQYGMPHHGDFEDRTLALLGALGALISKKHFMGGGDYKSDLKKGLEMFCALFMIPAYDLDGVVDRMDVILSENEIAIGDFFV